MQDHGHLGPGLGGDDVRRRRHDFLCPALPAGRRRGGLLPRHHPLPHLLVPQRSRAQALGLFYFGLPLALVLGGPLSGWLLEFHGIFGLANWQWLFVTEGLLASLVGIAAYFYLVDRPRDAGWLSDEQKRALEGELAEEDTRKQARGPHGFLSALRSGQVLKFCLVYFTIQMSVYGVVFYLPTRIASFLDGQVGLNVGLITAIPWVCALVVTRLVTRQADRSGQHRQLAVAMLGMAAAGIAASALAGNLGLAVIAFCFAASGFVSVQPLFWTLPTGYLSGAAAASGIALINSWATSAASSRRTSRPSWKASSPTRAPACSPWPPSACSAPAC